MGTQLESRAHYADAQLRVYYATVKALALGTLCRPGLPLEIILYVCQLAGFVSPWPDTSFSDKVDYDRSLAGTVMDGEDGAIARPWLCTQPIPGGLLRRIWKAEPHIYPVEPVMSRTHAFKPDELLVRIVPQCSAVSSYKCDEDGNPLYWRHLTNPSRKNFTIRPFDSTHEIWKWLESGDRLEISVEASSWYFPNVRSEWGVSLQVFKLWEPSEVMLGLIYGKC
ncbi:hypothetical protein RhiJN_01559 [Ceratobasidium sp. AG-Ba]|nr:hypothetical protein RhiJN_01559 [Ceratobasidium sp. AG-Ba]